MGKDIRALALWGTAAILAFCIWSRLVMSGYLEAIDILLTRLSAVPATGWLELFRFITQLGSIWTVMLAVALITVYFFFCRCSRAPGRALMFWLVPGGAHFLAILLKDFFQRVRPAGEHLVSAYGFAYPSGHALLAVAFYGYLAVVAGRRMRNPGRVLVGALAALLVFLIGWSRVYLGVHYPTDVLGGYLAGGAWVALVLLVDRATVRSW